ncbi:MAG: hypothetical protein HY365_01055 [Candidatus Aenigmarchaeota archaeon]|nr:hypothetical protein [Candidatus Aenigmarchaeota archaeon]
MEMRSYDIQKGTGKKEWTVIIDVVDLEGGGAIAHYYIDGRQIGRVHVPPGVVTDEEKYVKERYERMELGE